MNFEKYHVALKMYLIPFDEVSSEELITFFKELSSTRNATLEIWNDDYVILL